jgi:hypothetical protein
MDRLHQRSRDGDIPHPPQVAEGKMQPHPKHQEDHPQLGQLLDRLDIAHPSRCERPDRNPCQQVPDDRRKPELPRDDPAREGHDKR